MRAYLFANQDLLGSFDAKVIDRSMGIVGGFFKPTSLYLTIYQETFRNHLLKSDWNRMQALNLRVIAETGHELKPEGGILVTDLKEFPGDISIEVCGLASHDITSLLFS